MGFLKDKWNNMVKKATETATETVKEITKEDAKDTLEVLGSIAKIGIFFAIIGKAVKGTGSVHNVVSTVKAADVIEPITKTTTTAAPVVQIFLSEGKGVHIQ